MAKIATYRFFCAWLSRIIRPVKVLGNKKLKDERIIYCINHTSNWDFVVTLESFKISPICLYKAEFRKSKFFRNFLDGLGYIPVNRGEVDLNVTKKSILTLKQGGSLLIAPEGTRNHLHDGSFLPFKEGAVSLAIKTKTPLLPIYIFHPRNKKDKIVGKSYIVVGEVLHLNQFYYKPLNKDILQEANALLLEKFNNAKMQCDEYRAIKSKRRNK